MRRIVIGLVAAFALSVLMSNMFVYSVSAKGGDDGGYKGGGDDDDHKGGGGDDDDDDHKGGGNKGGGGGNNHNHNHNHNNAPEPLSYLLLASGGATLTGVRYWMAKRRSKKDVEASSDVEI